MVLIHSPQALFTGTTQCTATEALWTGATPSGLVLHSLRTYIGRDLEMSKHAYNYG